MSELNNYPEHVFLNLDRTAVTALGVLALVICGVVVITHTNHPIDENRRRDFR